MRFKILAADVRIIVIEVAPTSIAGRLYSPVERMGFVQITRIGMPLGDTTHQFPRPKGIIASTAECAEHRAALLPRDRRQRPKAVSLGRAIGANEKHRFTLRQVCHANSITPS